MKRKANESYEDYRERRRKDNKRIKDYLKGVPMSHSIAGWKSNRKGAK